MKILMLIRYLDYSGAPKMFLWVAKSLAERGYKITICTFKTLGGVEVPASLEWIDLTSEHLGFFGKIKRIRHIIKQGDYDVSISFLLDSNVYNIFACTGLRTKSVVCERNDPFKPGYYKLKFWKPWFRFADGAVFQLPKVAEYYNNIKGKTAVIPNPVGKHDVEVNKPFNERDDEIVSVGRIDIFQKRHDILIKAFAKFRETHATYHLTIYGDGEEKDIRQLNTLIKQLNIDNTVNLAGVVTNSIERIINAKMFVLSSDFEGIPNALIEAMVAGLPCISTDCRPGGARLLIEDGKNGLIVPAGDSDTLSEKMSFIAEHPNIADKMGKEAKNLAIHFSDNVIIEKWDNYLHSLLS